MRNRAATTGVCGGSKFTDRCSFVMDMSHRERPPLYLQDPNRVAECYLYRPASSLTPSRKRNQHVLELVEHSCQRI